MRSLIELERRAIALESQIEAAGDDDAEADRLGERLKEIDAQIAAQPAATPAGVAVKLRSLRRLAGPDLCHDHAGPLLDGALAGLERLGERP